LDWELDLIPKAKDLTLFATFCRDLNDFVNAQAAFLVSKASFTSISSIGRELRGGVNTLC
jgi:hypothetical protein